MLDEVFELLATSPHTRTAATYPFEFSAADSAVLHYCFWMFALSLWNVLWNAGSLPRYSLGETSIFCSLVKGQRQHRQESAQTNEDIAQDWLLRRRIRSSPISPLPLSSLAPSPPPILCLWHPRTFPTNAKRFASPQPRRRPASRRRSPASSAARPRRHRTRRAGGGAGRGRTACSTRSRWTRT